MHQQAEQLPGTTSSNGKLEKAGAVLGKKNLGKKMVKNMSSFNSIGLFSSLNNKNITKTVDTPIAINSVLVSIVFIFKYKIRFLRL